MSNSGVFKRLEITFNRISGHEKINVRKYLELTNSKYGSQNNYLRLFDSINDETKPNGQYAVFQRKTGERLENKVYESLSQEFQQLNLDTSAYYKNRVRVHKYLLHSEIANSLRLFAISEYFLLKALKVSQRIEAYGSQVYTLELLHNQYSAQNEHKKAKRIMSRIDQVRNEQEVYDFASNILKTIRSNQQYHFSRLDFDESDYYRLIKLKKEDLPPRLMRTVLYATISVIEFLDPLLSNQEKVTVLSSSLKDLSNIYAQNPCLFAPREVVILDLNLALFSLYVGNNTKACSSIKDIFSENKDIPIYRNHVANAMQRCELLLTEPWNVLVHGFHKNNIEGLILLSTKKVVIGDSALKDLKNIPFKQLSPIWAMQIRLICILSALNKNDYDLADYYISSFESTTKKNTTIHIYRYIVKALLEWQQSGFNKEISDLPEELVAPIKHHYENTWNPLSPDLIPLHLWRKKEGIPNYKDAYAHLFACKRRIAAEQGISMD